MKNEWLTVSGRIISSKFRVSEIPNYKEKRNVRFSKIEDKTFFLSFDLRMHMSYFVIRLFEFEFRYLE